MYRRTEEVVRAEAFHVKTHSVVQRVQNRYYKLSLQHMDKLKMMSMFVEIFIADNLPGFVKTVIKPLDLSNFSRRMR